MKYGIFSRIFWRPGKKENKIGNKNSNLIKIILQFNQRTMNGHVIDPTSQING